MRRCFRAAVPHGTAGPGRWITPLVIVATLAVASACSDGGLSSSEVDGGLLGLSLDTVSDAVSVGDFAVVFDVVAERDFADADISPPADGSPTRSLPTDPDDDYVGRVVRSVVDTVVWDDGERVVPSEFEFVTAGWNVRNGSRFAADDGPWFRVEVGERYFGVFADFGGEIGPMSIIAIYGLDGDRLVEVSTAGGPEQFDGATLSVVAAMLGDATPASVSSSELESQRSGSTLSDFVGDDPLGLLGDGWERIGRDTTEYTYAAPVCPAQETYASLTGSPVVVDTYRSPVGDGVEVDVSVIDIPDAASRAQLVVAAFDEVSECPLDTSFGIDSGVALLEQRWQGASGYYGSDRGFIVVAPDEFDAAPFAVILEPRGHPIPQAVVDHLVGRSRALLLTSEQPPEPPPYLDAASIQLGADPLGLVANGWSLRWRDTDRLSVGDRRNDCVEWTEFDTLDGTTYWSDDMTYLAGGIEWYLDVGYWTLTPIEATALVDGFDRLVQCPSVEDAGRDADLFTLSTDDDNWMIGGYFVTGESAHVAIASPDGRAVTLETSRFELDRTDLESLVVAALTHLDPSAPRRPTVLYEPVTPGVTSPRLTAFPQDPLGLLADGLDGRDTYATDFDLRSLLLAACDEQLSNIAELGRLPALRGSYWTPGPNGYQVDIQIVDLTSRAAANTYWNAAPLLTMCSIATMTGASLDDLDLQVRTLAPDVLAFTPDNTNGWYSVLGPTGIVATLTIEATEATETDGANEIHETAPVDALIDRTRQLLALDLISE
ncbi:MAG TPA: hypothetical protein VMM60_13215 [Ilumatobacter sp.]|nr:hypothetical protein [Ilumatobacter sp.]